MSWTQLWDEVIGIKYTKTMLQETLCYPLYMLRVNRILNTVISRKKVGRNIVQDTIDIIKVRGNGIRALFAGYVPFMISSNFFYEAVEQTVTEEIEEESP